MTEKCYNPLEGKMGERSDEEHIVGGSEGAAGKPVAPAVVVIDGRVAEESPEVIAGMVET